MDNALETIEKDGKRIDIYIDETPTSPREDFTLGKILYISDRYTLGDQRVSNDEIDEITLRKDIVVLPVYAYIHGGIALNTTGFHCPWDSGQSGIIYAEYSDIRETFNVKRITNATIEKVKNVLRMEIETYAAYINGEVYGYVITKAKTCDTCGHVERKEIGSCWGFYGLDYCKEEAESAAGIEG